MEELYNLMRQRYLTGDMPWDSSLPPPEVIELAKVLPAGRMLDLGCGPGRACIYLAGLGWQCDGVDFIPEAIERAKAWAVSANVAGRTRFYNASVAALDFLQPSYDLAVDVGCLHAQTAEVKEIYANNLKRLIRPDGYYLLFARLKAENISGLSEGEISELFQPDFTIERFEKGTTDFRGTIASSAWVWLRRKSAG
jgi:SAM-dependent methyltransferase